MSAPIASFLSAQIPDVERFDAGVGKRKRLKKRANAGSWWLVAKRWRKEKSFEKTGVAKGNYKDKTNHKYTAR